MSTSPYAYRTYVGITTKKLGERLRAHRYSATIPRLRKKYPIAQAIFEYGWTAFDVRVLEECETIAELSRAERHWIAKLGTLASDNQGERRATIRMRIALGIV
jgi:hypothetical protein